MSAQRSVGRVGNGPLRALVLAVLALAFAAPAALAQDERPAPAPAASLDAGMPDAGDLDASTDAGDGAIDDAAVDAATELDVPLIEPPATVEPDSLHFPTILEEISPPVAPEDARDVVSIVVGLLMLFGLASLLSHPSVVALQRYVRIQSAITAGFPFVGLGLLAKHPSIGVLSEQVIVELTPILQFGLGWLGFIVGFQLEPRRLDRLPQRTVLAVGSEVLATFVLIGLAGAGLMLAFGQEWRDAKFLRDALVLATAGAITSPSARGKWRAAVGADDRDQFVHLDAFAGALGLAAIAVYFRPVVVDSAWELPGTAWLFLSAGMGAALGALVSLMLRSTASSAEFMAIALGSVALASGMAAHVNVSPLAVCFFTGVVVTSFGGEHRDALSALLVRVEAPIYLVFLAIAGALWQPADYRGWLLMAAFVAARVGGLVLARRFQINTQPGRSVLVKAPVSGLAIAVVVSAQALYQGRAVPWIVTAVIGGAIITEILAQIGAARSAPTPHDSPVPPRPKTPLTASLPPPPNSPKPPAPSVPPTAEGSS